MRRSSRGEGEEEKEARDELDPFLPSKPCPKKDLQAEGLSHPI